MRLKKYTKSMVSYLWLKPVLKKLLVLVSALTIYSVSRAQISSTCINADFEEGNFNGWQGSTGECCPINTPVNGIVMGRHTIMTGAGTDSLACDQITHVAPAGTYSVRLGNSDGGAEAERLQYTVSVTANNSLFMYKYAVVLEDPGHIAEEQPRFNIRILNSNGQIVDSICGQYNVVAGDSIEGFETCGDVKYKPWTTVGMDMTPYIGQNITIEFSTGDCSKGAHFGYAYIDAYCSSLTINSDYCPGAHSTTLTAPPGFNYLWNTGETTQNIIVNNPTQGQLFTCQLTSVTGCQVNLSTLLKPVNPTASFTFNTNCYNNVSFTDASVTPVNTTITDWKWNFGDGNTSTSQNPVHSYSSTGAFDVQLIVTNSAGCMDTIVQKIKANPIPMANFNHSLACVANSVFFTDASAISSGMITGWKWDFGDGSPHSFNKNTSHVYASAGIYNVQLLVTSKNGCKDSVVVPLTVQPNPSVDFEPYTAGCSPLCMNFNDLSEISDGANQKWLWDFGNGATSNLQNPIHCYVNNSANAPIKYTVTLSVTSDKGCTTIKEKKEFITVNPLPIAEFDFSPQPTTIEKPIIYFQNQSTGLYNSQWNFGDNQPNNTSNEQHPSYTYIDTGKFIVTLIVENDFNCSDTIEKVVLIGPEWKIFIPNAFTPDNDGLNDIFIPKGINIREFEMLVFNRWGEMIFSTYNIDQGWNGTSENKGGAIVQQGVYFYRIKIKDVNLQEHNYRGEVTVIR